LSAAPAAPPAVVSSLLAISGWMRPLSPTRGLDNVVPVPADLTTNDPRGRVCLCTRPSHIFPFKSKLLLFILEKPSKLTNHTNKSMSGPHLRQTGHLFIFLGKIAHPFLLLVLYFGS
jgi:hypothetical protein